MIFHDSGLILAPDYNYQGIIMVLIYRFDNLPWLWTLSRQYILDCAIGIHALINHWIITLTGYGDVSR